MFGAQSVNIKSLSKRINRQLVGNFFTIEEFKQLTDRQAFKVIKTISKIEEVKLSRKEIKSIVAFIKSDFSNVEEIKSAVKLWDFVVSLIEEKVETRKENYSTSEIFIPHPYRLGRYDLLRM